jgi:MFS family permease
MGVVGSLTSMIAARVLLEFGEARRFRSRPAMADWTPASKRGWAQGITHSTARLGNAITPPLIAWLIAIVTWRGSFVILGCCSLVWVVVWVLYYRDLPVDHPSITREELETLPNQGRASTLTRPQVPWQRLALRMLPVTIVYFCYGWTLWLYLNWLPSFFLHEYKLEITRSALFSSDT